MKILSAKQVKQLDKSTIEEQGMVSIELMERASVMFVDWFIKKYTDKERLIQVICGTGDNGGDGLAVARLLSYLKYRVEVFIIPVSSKPSRDFEINFEQIKGLDVSITDIDEAYGIPDFPYGAITIDAILGSGLNRPLDGFLVEVITDINASCDTIVSIDIASGLFADKPTNSTSILPTDTFSFELPKLAFMFAENAQRVGKWATDTIHLSEEALQKLPTDSYYISDQDIRVIYKTRAKFAHKGSFGHSLLVTGSYGMMGASVLATRACLRSGSGLVSVHIPESGYEIMQASIPEAIASIDKDRFVFTFLPENADYTAIGVGCGLSQQEKSFPAIRKLLIENTCPLVIDADALNIIASQNWQKSIPKGSIITPHAKEFERLFGETENDFQTNELQRQKSKELGITIVLKGSHTSVTMHDGSCFFNSTGNPGMATGGSGDVLTGIITGLLAQGYMPEEAAVLGVYAHGLAGDFAAEKVGEYSLIASDIIDNLGAAFLKIEAIHGS
jgi:hydroxyethylthiazole kinase-like uncharacterized protein yjeF